MSNILGFQLYSVKINVVCRPDVNLEVKKRVKLLFRCANYSHSFNAKTCPMEVALIRVR